MPPTIRKGRLESRHSCRRCDNPGWADGRNVRIDTRWAASNPDNFRKYAAELVTLAPDVILAFAAPSVARLQEATRTVPIVFAFVADPVGAGFVDSLARPGGNTTGFMQFEYSLSGKWLELLKQIVPGVTRAAVIRDPANPSSIAQFAAIQAVAPSLGVEVNSVGVRDATEIERAVSAFARASNGGLIVTGGRATDHRELIITPGGSAPASGGLPLPLLRHRRRLDLLWA